MTKEEIALRLTEISLNEYEKVPKHNRKVIDEILTIDYVATDTVNLFNNIYKSLKMDDTPTNL